MTKRTKVIFICCLTLIVMIFISVKLYMGIMNTPWQTEQAAKQTALSETEMTEVERIEHFHGEESYAVVFGKNAQGESMMVWVGNDDVIVRLVKEGISRNILKGNLIKENIGEIIHILPGVKEEELVWEVFYKKKEQDHERYYYDYYRFEDGEHLDTYVMSIK